MNDTFTSKEEFYKHQIREALRWIVENTSALDVDRVNMGLIAVEYMAEPYPICYALDISENIN